MSIHQGQPTVYGGESLENAKAAMIMIHGRGASAESILMLANEVNQAGFAYIAPQAANYAWYPNRFIVPIEANQPYLDSALARVGEVVAEVKQAGLPSEKIVLLGFSQGACLALEYAARNPEKYGGVIGLSGGLIGDSVSAKAYDGDLTQTPVFLGCSDTDFHIPLERVQESTAIFKSLGAMVTERIYPNMGHTVNRDELDFIRQLLVTTVS